MGVGEHSHHKIAGARACRRAARGKDDIVGKIVGFEWGGVHV